ncbi:phosphoenolpyruvate carboxylase-related kinase 1 [Actinidia rufa]|uniref:Phosphoenolpyruvate carboxylase-related kinase 1 n=1 Tax=Actinidia rufa TaxID=165716 RepID=A0A7J0GXJ1_9ERIC|nr:phosphoenolpyruvate carboxylase-related kinase 1 [Actinidia rufa]
MAVANSNSNSNKEPSFHLCNCYKVASLHKTILDTNQASNLKDRYALGEQLGWGQFGIIRVCSDKLTDLKAVYEEEDFVHLVMELCAGGELFHQLEKHGRFFECDARVLFRQLMQVVTFCHDKGVVHRDLKPENILLSTKSSSSPIKLADFGLATYIKPGQNLHGTVGSPFYIAPEVLTGGYNQAADVWSAGVILYILLSGMPPFWGKTKSRIFDAVRAADLQFPSDPWDRISYSAKELICGMLCRDPSQRFTAQQVLDHAWISHPAPLSERSIECQKHRCGESDTAPFSSSLMARNEDISFSAGSPLICDTQSPGVTCRSSFSSFLVDPLTPCFASGGFSFQSSGESDTLEFSTPISSMPSFTFFSPVSESEQGNCELNLSANIPRVDLIHRGNFLSYLSTSYADCKTMDNRQYCSSYAEASLGKHFGLPGLSPCFGHGDREMGHKVVEVKRSEGTSGSRMSGIHSKRNRTIGLGEFDQLDLMVTESVIRLGIVHSPSHCHIS